MIVISFFVVLAGIVGYFHLKHEDNVVNEKLRKSAEEIWNNTHWFLSRYVAEDSLEYDVYDETKKFLYAKSMNERYNDNIETDPIIEECYNIAKDLSVRQSDLSNIQILEPKPFVEVVLAKKYGKIRKHRAEFGYKPNEYALADWIRCNLNDSPAPILCGMCDDNGFFYYCWEKSDGYYHYNGYYDRLKTKIKRV